MYGYDEVSEMSIKIIKKLNANNIKCTVLTKGILPIDLSEFSKDNEYGITLISLNEAYREKMEPGAAPIKKRIQALKNLSKKGCKTWVSMEPYPTPNLIEQSLMEILKELNFVDKNFFGRTNYSKEVSAYREHRQYYNQCAEQVINFCNENGIDYHIKDDTIT